MPKKDISQKSNLFMSKYQYNNAKYGSHRLILSLLEKNKLVLDIGCGKGYLGTHSKKNRFYGIEVDQDSARKARKIYQKIVVGDVEQLTDPFPGIKFDFIIFADILEHLTYPLKTLIYFVENYLADSGKVIISLPNVAHLTIRINLLLGKFDYVDCGILDKNHLHLYTCQSAKKLIKKSGIDAEKVCYSSNRFGWLIEKFPFLGSVLGFNLIFLCRKKNKNENFD